MYRMVVTDLDGTLLNSQKQVSDANAKAIYKLKDQNITFVMATGRSDVMTKAYTKQLKNADIVEQDYYETISKAKKNDFVFIDPPYTVKHNSNAFIKYNENLFSWKDQKN